MVSSLFIDQLFPEIVWNKQRNMWRILGAEASHCKCHLFSFLFSPDFHYAYLTALLPCLVFHSDSCLFSFHFTFSPVFCVVVVVLSCLSFRVVLRHFCLGMALPPPGRKQMLSEATSAHCQAHIRGFVNVWTSGRSLWKRWASESGR